MHTLERLVVQMGTGISVTACADQPEFLDALQAEDPDVFFVDYDLGSWCGTEAVAMLRDQPRHQGTPVIMVSHHSDTATAVEAIKAGCSDYIEKSKLTADSLRRTVCDVLTGGLAGTVARDQVTHVAECIITGMTEGCLGELRPRLQSMYHQICLMRDCQENGILPSTESLDTVEADCLQIWRFANELSEYGRSFNRLH